MELSTIFKNGYLSIPGEDRIDDENEGDSFKVLKSRKLFFLWSPGVIFFIALSLLFISLSAYHFNRERATLLKVNPFKAVTHPDPPTTFWGIVSKPYPTGAFWSNLAVKNGDGAIGLYPYGIKALDAGIQVSYGAFRRVVSKSAITDTFSTDLQISCSQSYLSRAIEAYDNISVTMGYKYVGTGKMKAFLVKSSPFVTVVFENTTPIISSGIMKIISVDSRVMKDSQGVQYIVTLGNFQKWLVYCSEPVALVWKENTLSSPNPIRGYVRVAVLPLQNFEAAATMLLTYVQKYPIGASVSLTYPTGTTANLNIQYNTVGAGPLLMLALPHHAALMQQPQIDSEESKRIQSIYNPIWCIKGKMKAVVGETWKLQYNLVQIGWNYVVADKLSTSQLDEIAKNLLLEVKITSAAPVDAYSFGKVIGRMARLALIADNLGIAEARQQAISGLENFFIPWLQGMNQDFLVYDKTYGGLVTTSSLADPMANFGSGWYADHHFHFGYFVNAAAVLARFDQPFYESNKAALDSFVRDICNPDSTDTDYPVARHKDFYDGHSWASGLFQQANGKGQESSSEAVNAYYGAYLYGLATGNTDLLRFSHILLTMEIQAAQTYWHMSSDDIYDSMFSSSRMVGNIGALDATTSTWFGNDLEFVHGINMMPLSPATALLFDSSYVQLQYPILASRLPPPVPPGSSQCSANAACKALNLVGLCCPALDGQMLSCCDAATSSQARLLEEWRSYIYVDLAGKLL